jgi:hypothetical protein
MSFILRSLPASIRCQDIYQVIYLEAAAIQLNKLFFAARTFANNFARHSYPSCKYTIRNKQKKDKTALHDSRSIAEQLKKPTSKASIFPGGSGWN